MVTFLKLVPLPTFFVIINNVMVFLFLHFCQSLPSSSSTLYFVKSPKFHAPNVFYIGTSMQGIMCRTIPFLVHVMLWELDV